MRRLALAALLLHVLVAPLASAQQYTVSERTGKKLLQAQELLQAEKYAEAKQILAGIKVERLSDYERALVYQFQAFVAHGQDDSAAAIRYFEKCLKEEALPPTQQLQLRFNLAQLYMGAEKWPLAIANLEKWFASAPEPNAIAHYTLAVAYYQNEQKNEALKPARKAYELEKQPKESWISLLLSLYLDRGEYGEARPLLEQLAIRFPKKVYWMQLSAIYAELQMDEKSLAVQQLAYAQGYLQEQSELLRLARMYLYHDLPYRAAEVLEKALREQRVEAGAESFELLGQSLMAAREFDRALGPMAKAAELSGDGELWLRLGQVRVEREEWKEAAQALRKAIAKGDFDDVGTAHLLLGIAAYNQEQFDTARAAFSSATQHEDTRKAASQWLEHVTREAEAS